MIGTLHIRNIGIIEDLSIDLNRGLNVLTGETGAGKTLIIDSLQIISGGRFSKEMIRRGETNSFVELCMYEPENREFQDGTIIVSREINNNGKNMCKINGRMVTVNELKSFMSKYIEIHGQNDNQNLLDNKLHLNYLDGFIGNDIRKTKEEYLKLYLEYNEVKKELKENFGDDKEKQRKLDLLQYQVNEIEEAGLKEKEEEELEEKRKMFLNSEKISENLTNADSLIGVYFDEEERNFVEERLNLISLLKRKYGNTINEILNYKNEVLEEIDRIQNLEEYTNKLNIRKKELENKMDILADKLHSKRKEYATILSENINNELVELEMKNAKINIHVEKREEYIKTGKDNVLFYIRTNIGEEEKELSKIASGGEMSRTMLAIKKVLADSDKMPVLVFDEIDTGISGKAANSVADKLKSISKKHQVLCISHLPNIAALADYNYFISKEVTDKRTKTNIKLLEEKEVIEEIARISSGEINDITLKYAERLRNKKAS